MTAISEWCATTSQDREEPLAATASRVERWLLVEHRGAWGPQSVPSSRMPVTVARSLAAATAASHARLLLIRRPAGVPCQDGRWVFAVDSRPGAEQVLARHVADDDDLLTLVAPDAPGWQPVAGPLLLVCTHGRHDRCCATRGRPVAQALAAAHPETTWECSHVGGDRFAANLLVLPEGLYLGRVLPGEAVQLVADLAAGLLPAGRLRGRSSLPLPTQAAQEFARQQLGRWRTDDLWPLTQEPAGPDRWRVRLAGSPHAQLPGAQLPGADLPEVEVIVRYDRLGDGGSYVLTCGAADEKTAAVFRLDELQVLASA